MHSFIDHTFESLVVHHSQVPTNHQFEYYLIVSPILFEPPMAWCALLACTKKEINIQELILSSDLDHDQTNNSNLTTIQIMIKQQSTIKNEQFVHDLINTICNLTMLHITTRTNHKVCTLYITANHTEENS